MGNLVRILVAGCVKSGTNYGEVADPQGVSWSYEDDNSGTVTAVKGAAAMPAHAVSTRSGRSR